MLPAETDVEAALESTKGSEGALERPECIPSDDFFVSPGAGNCELKGSDRDRECTCDTAVSVDN